MGLTALLLQPGTRFGASFRSSTLLGDALRHPGCACGLRIDKRRVVVVAVRSEFAGEEKREEEKSKLLGVASASIGFNAVLLMSVAKPAVPVSVSHKDSQFSRLSLPLLAIWGAILLNAFVQYRVLERLTALPQRRESPGRVDFTLKHRVEDLEENVREFVTTARGLSKQVEKLGVRFRATKLTLRDPMQETAAYAQKTSQVTTLLAKREDRLEEELRGLQRALLAMQEHQVKQLALISLALKRTQVERIPSSVTSTAADAHVRAPPPGVVETTPKSKTTTSSPTFTPKVADSHTRSTEDEGIVNGAPSAPKIPFSSEGSLSKVDFWKESVTSSAVLDKMTADAPPDRSNLGSFFNGRKRSTTTFESAHVEPTPEEPEDVSSYVGQPDYDSDSWLR